MKRTTRRIITALLGVTAALTSVAILGPALWERDARTEARAQPTGQVDERAAALVRRMGAYLGRLPAFSVKADHLLEVVTEEGQKLQFGATSSVVVKRPNKLRTNRKGEAVDMSLYYDGETMALYGRRANMYATAKAPPNLDAAIEFGRQSLDLEAPGADLLFSDPYQILMENVVSGEYIGETVVRGQRCHHLAFRNETTDWQLWVAAGDRPLPCKYVITSKDMPGAPQFSVELYDWNTNPQISERMFTLTPPEDAMEIDFFAPSKQTEEKGQMR